MVRYATAVMIVFGVIASYIFLLLQHDTFVGLVSTANTTSAAAATNPAVYASFFAVLNSSPLWIWALPAVMGGILVAITLVAGRRPSYY